MNFSLILVFSLLFERCFEIHLFGHILPKVHIYLQASTNNTVLWQYTSITLKNLQRSKISNVLHHFIYGFCTSVMCTICTHFLVLAKLFHTYFYHIKYLLYEIPSINTSYRKEALVLNMGVHHHTHNPCPRI